MRVRQQTHIIRPDGNSQNLHSEMEFTILRYNRLMGGVGQGKVVSATTGPTIESEATPTTPCK